MFQVDNATAQEIIVQIERSIASTELAEANAARTASINDAKYIGNAPVSSRKGGAPPKSKSTI